MIEVVTVIELVVDSATEVVTALEVEKSVVEAAGSDVLLVATDATPEIIEVS